MQASHPKEFQTPSERAAQGQCKPGGRETVDERKLEIIHRMGRVDEMLQNRNLPFRNSTVSKGVVITDVAQVGRYAGARVLALAHPLKVALGAMNQVDDIRGQTRNRLQDVEPFP